MPQHYPLYKRVYVSTKCLSVQVSTCHPLTDPDCYLLFSLDIIGAVGLSHTFAAQSTRPGSDAEQIFASWTQHVNNGLQRLAFLAPLVVRAVPIVTKAPLPLMRSQGVIKTIVTRIGRRIIERERAALGKDSLLDIPSNDSGRMDIISVLLRNRRLASASEKLSDTQILDNVCCFLSSPS